MTNRPTLQPPSRRQARNRREHRGTDGNIAQCSRIHQVGCRPALRRGVRRWSVHMQQAICPWRVTSHAQATCPNAAPPIAMLKQYLSQKLQQKLSPQQIQLMKLLQVPTLELEQRIKQEMEENPALEEGEDHDEDEVPTEEQAIDESEEE